MLDRYPVDHLNILNTYLTHCCGGNKPHNNLQIPIKLDVFCLGSYSNYKHTNFIKVRMKHK